MERLESCLINREETALFADYYEFTSGKADFDHGDNETITETFFVRNVPKYLGAYLVSAGLEQVVEFIKNYHISAEDAKWLKVTSGKDFDEKFIDYLRKFKFHGDIYAMPEGTIFFPNEPVLSITGPSVDVQMFETYLLAIMNFQTLIATKASRIVNAADGRTVLEFGSRRAHGRDAALLGARAAYIGGSDGSALVLAGKKLGIPYIGTMPHKFVQERDSELDAFREYAESFPRNTVLLIDTYDAVSGAENACTVGKELRNRGCDLMGVRIDSGNLLQLSEKVRTILDRNGFKKTKIFASSDLDEYQIADLVAKGAPIDGFGVGTRLITGANFDSVSGNGAVSALGGVYKLVEVRRNGVDIPTIKISNDSDKTTLPGRKQVYRFYDGDKFAYDEITRFDEKRPNGERLLVPIMRAGRLVYKFPKINGIRKNHFNQLLRLDKAYKKLKDSPLYKVKISDDLAALKRHLIESRAELSG